MALRGSRQVVRRQPSKLIFAGSNPVSRSDVGKWQVEGPMAQWLAQATHNRLVVGSNPTGPTF